MFLGGGRGGGGGKEKREAKKRRQRVMRLVSALSIWLGGGAFNDPSALNNGQLSWRQKAMFQWNQRLSLIKNNFAIYS